MSTGFSHLIDIISEDLEPNDWRFTMRFTPFVLGLILIMIIIAYREPEREIVKSTNNENISQQDPKSFSSDIRDLIYNKTYVLITLCWICCLGSLGLFLIFKIFTGTFLMISKFIFSNFKLLLVVGLLLLLTIHSK